MAEINIAFYDDLGDSWWTAQDHMIAFLRAENAIRIDFIKKHLPTAKGPLRLLDLGSGGGLITIPMAQEGHHLTALDLSETSLAVLNQQAERKGVSDHITTLQADMMKPWPVEGPFDVILAMDVLEHVSAPHAVIAQAQAMLKPGGIFIYHTLNQTWLCWLIYLQLAPRIMRNSPKDIHIYDYCIKPEWMSDWLQQTGFTHHEQIGLRPKLNLNIIWQLLRERQLNTELQFDYCQSLALGYIGWAQLAPAQKESLATTSGESLQTAGRYY